MIEPRRPGRTLQAGILVILALIMLLLGRAQVPWMQQAGDLVTEFATPVLEMLSRPVNQVRRLGERTMDYSAVYAENERLRAELERLKVAEHTAEQLQIRVNRLEALLNVQLEPSIEYVTGRVISDSGGPFVDTVITNIGRRAGATNGQAVVDGDGLVGRVISTGPDASRVLLLSDLNSRIPVAIQPSNFKAILAGDNSDRPVLQYLSNDAKIAVGDRVVTSGDGGLMPAGIPVGMVVEALGGEKRVEVFSDKDRLTYVRVLRFAFPEDIDTRAPPPALGGPSGAEGELGTGAQTAPSEGEKSPTAPTAEGGEGETPAAGRRLGEESGARAPGGAAAAHARNEPAPRGHNTRTRTEARARL